MYQVHIYRILLVLSFLLHGLYAKSSEVDTTFIYLKNGGVDVYPSDVAIVGELTNDGLEVVWSDGTVVGYAPEEIDHIGDEAPMLPKLKTFKIDNKFNHQVFTDVEADIGEEEISLTVGCIGKWLTPTFSVSDDHASVYIDNELQRSKVSRHHFNHDVVYTVALPNMYILRRKEMAANDASDYAMEVYGKEYTLHVTWLSDEASNVPIVSIQTKDGQMISSKDYYVDAEISIDGAGVFPSLDTIPVHIKGRGNSSWSTNPWSKNPYRLKFDEKVKPFGLTKGKNWVLLANKLEGSMMTNAIGMKAASLANTAFANHIIPIELYINGQYRGSYNFTEKIGFSNNSIDLEDETDAVLLELDTNYDETYKFKSNPYKLPVNIKEPDFSEGITMLSMSDISNDFNRVMRKLKNGEEIAEEVDLEYLARYLLVSELIENYELMHPKSTFLYKESVKGGSKYIFGPIWDLDWAFGYELYRNYYSGAQEADYYNKVWMEARQFVNDLRYVSSQLDRTYYKVWTQFMRYGLSELLDFCEEYFAYAQTSFIHNHKKWKDGNDYEASTLKARNWLQRRANYIYEHLTTYDLTEEEMEPSTGIIHIDDGKEYHDGRPSGLADIYNLQGQCVRHHVSVTDLRKNLSPGIYIVNGKKMVVK